MIIDGFANRIRELRKETGLSQEKVALKNHMDRTYYYLLKQEGEIYIVNTMRIADGFGITLEEFFKGL